LRRRIDELIREWSLLIEETIETESSVLGHPIEATTSFIRLAHAVRAMRR